MWHFCVPKVLLVSRKSRLDNTLPKQKLFRGTLIFLIQTNWRIAYEWNRLKTFESFKIILLDVSMVTFLINFVETKKWLGFLVKTLLFFITGELFYRCKEGST